jgi:hypothetical protein
MLMRQHPFRRGMAVRISALCPRGEGGVKKLPGT